MGDFLANPYQGIVLFMPTRNRAEIAIQSIELILKTSLPELTLLVSDNSTDKVQAQALEEYCLNQRNPCLQYIRPPQPLSMGANMDWLLGQALTRFSANHFVCQWDRMVLKPEASAILRQAALCYPDDVITFQWDEIRDAEQPITLYQHPSTDLLLRVKTERLLWLAAHSREGFAPKMTNCLMPRSVIQAVHSRFGSYCNSITADICFGYRALALIDSILVYDRALTVTYGLYRSNAHSQQNGMYNQDTKDFLKNLQLQDQVLNWATPIPEATVPGNQTIHEYCLVKKEVDSDRFPDVNWNAYLEMLATQTLALQKPEVRHEMETVLVKHHKIVPSLPNPDQPSTTPTLPVRVKNAIKSFIYSPATKPFWMTIARRTNIGLPLDQKFLFRTSRGALDCALYCPSRRFNHTYLLQDLFDPDIFAVPTSIIILPNPLRAKKMKLNSAYTPPNSLHLIEAVETLITPEANPTAKSASPINSKSCEVGEARQVFDEEPPTHDPAGHEAAFDLARLPMALFKAIRPQQATKNLFVFAALVFTGRLLDTPLFGKVMLAFFLFSLTTGSIYLLNDLMDVEQDRQHPKKRYRPIASGALPLPLAWISMTILAIGSLSAGFLLRPAFGLALVGYFVLQIAYCLALKHIVLIDVFTIAIGFVLRAVAGALVINASISNWLLLCTLQLALFLGFGKRRQELVLLGDSAGKHRSNLDDYSVPLLDQIINIVVGITIVCYSVYSVESPTAHLHPHLWITVPVVIYALFRYMYLVYQRGWGGAPDEVLQKDRALQVAICVWFLLVLLLLKFDHGGWSKFGN